MRPTHSRRVAQKIAKAVPALGRTYRAHSAHLTIDTGLRVTLGGVALAAGSLAALFGVTVHDALGMESINTSLQDGVIGATALGALAGAAMIYGGSTMASTPLDKPTTPPITGFKPK